MSQLATKFVELTSTNLKTASQYLKLSKNNLEAAVNEYYNSLSKQQGAEIWNAYAKDGKMELEETKALLDDLEVEGDDPVFIGISYFLRSKQMCEFEHGGFLSGCQELGISNIAEFKKVIPNIKKRMEDEKTFKQIYLYTFGFAKNPEQKSMSLETALAFWDLLLADKFKYLEEWKLFLNEKPAKAISKDTWNLFYDFVIGFTSFEDHDLEGESY